MNRIAIPCLFLFFCCFFSNCHTSQGSTTTTTSSTTTSTTTPPSPYYQTLTYDNFDPLMKETSGLRMAYFWAEWCGPCRTIDPYLDNISRDYSGQITIGKLNVDDESITAQIHGVRSIPAFLFFKDGEIVHRTSGFVTEEYLTNVVEQWK